MVETLQEKRNRRFEERQQKKQNGRLTPGRIALRALAVLGTLLLSLIIILFGAITVVCKGPSPSARDLFVTTVMETSAAKFLAQMYFTDEEIIKIQEKNAVAVVNEVTETHTDFTSKQDALPLDTIEVLDVSGKLFKGKLMIVHDPARVHVATAPAFGNDALGLRVEELIKSEDAIAGVNGGGFEDINGVGKGGKPLGLVIKNSKLLSGSLTASHSVVGFDENNVLVVGMMTGQEALNKKIRDAVSFGPVFVVNGKAAQVTGTGGGLNPRTVIGQRADGAVLLLVIDGRQAHSIGASYEDCIDVMMKHGAINAANLDGGSSSMMIYKGEVLNVCASLYGSRRLPTAFVVK